MNEEAVKELLNYGVLGVMVVAMSGYIYFLHRQHSKEREEWRGMAKDFNDTTKENIGLIKKIEGMLSTRK